MKKLTFVKVERKGSPNWRYGKPIHKNQPKEIVVVTFMDEKGSFYIWSPLKNETNDIAKSVILAEELNFSNLKNPERRDDVDELKRLLSNFM